MLRPERMKEVQLLVRAPDAERTINILAQAKSLHIKDHQKVQIEKTTIDIGTPLESAEELSDSLVKTRSLLSRVKEGTPQVVSHAKTLSERITHVEELAVQYAQHETELVAQQSEKERLERLLGLLQVFPNVDGPLSALLTSRSTAGILFKAQPNEKINAVLTTLNPIFVEHNIEHHTTLVALPKAQFAEAVAQVKSTGAEVIDISSIAQCEVDLLHSKEQIQKFITTNQENINKTQSALLQFSENSTFLKETEPILALELLKAQAPLHFGATKRVVLIHGFVPEKQTQSLFEKIASENIDIVAEATSPKDAPTLMHNPRPARGFEALMSLYTLPKYHEIDPTSLMAITFPVFFGFMLGDIGYGLCVLLLAIWLHSKPSAKPYAEVLGVSAVSAIAFGFVFGEIFGASSILGLHLPILLHRSEDILQMFGIALAFGVVHVNLGLILGIINESHEEGVVFGILKKGGWLLFEVGVFLIAAATGALTSVPALANVPQSWPLAIFVTALAVLGIWYGEHLRGLLELPMIFTNVLSYLRLVAIGLSSVAFALVTNDLGGGMLAKGGIFILFGVLILIAGHTINLALGLLGPALHALRLHYVEFFLKFYEGGGVAYKPFGVVKARS